jgi:hypothetical protein
VLDKEKDTGHRESTSFPLRGRFKVTITAKAGTLLSKIWSWALGGEGFDTKKRKLTDRQLQSFLYLVCEGLSYHVHVIHSLHN